MRAPSVIHQARGSGRWFPGDRQTLDTMVQSYVKEAAAPAVSGRIVAAIAPHAGYVYSGKVAGHTYRALRDIPAAAAPETVVILGFSHREGFRGVALLDGDALATPLGRAPLDVEAAAILTNASPRLFLDDAPHNGEHSAENQVPFVQVALPTAKLVIGLLGDHTPDTIDALVAALGKLAATRRIVVVASTDLLHDADHALVTKTDRATLALIGGLDVDGLTGAWSYDRQLCCGIGPVLAAMRFAKAQGCREGTVLCYRNSGDDFPESRGNWVVGYGAVVFATPE